ncbi:MAG TPA: EamA family transporter [Clostridiales bacterium]|nr:EamA family transporter [Clostridiales bacterium]
MLISALIIVGTIGIFRRYIPLSSALLAFFRGLIGSVSLFIFIKLRRTGRWQSIEPKKLVGLIVNGAFLGINWILLFEAYNYTTIAKATLCYYMQPTIILLLSPLVFKEKLTVKKVICALVALAGMVFVSGVIGEEARQANDFKGVLFGLGAACFYSLVIILNKKISDVDAYQKTIIQLVSSAVALIPYLLVTGGFKDVVFNVNLVLLLLVVGIIHTGVVYALYFGSMSGLKAQTISTLSYIDPVVAMIMSALILGETMTVWGVIGAVLIIGSAIVSELEPKLYKSQFYC